jgi:hypothetical protein
LAQEFKTENMKEHEVKREKRGKAAAVVVEVVVVVVLD